MKRDITFDELIDVASKTMMDGFELDEELNLGPEYRIWLEGVSCGLGVATTAAVEPVGWHPTQVFLYGHYTAAKEALK